MSEEKESVETKMGSLEDVLGMIDRVNETFAYEVWVPSLGKNVMFRELTTSQQKRLIKTIIDSPVYNTEFIFTLRKIIKENCADTEVNVDDLTILDKLIIAMKMRSVSIGDTIELKFAVDGTEDNTIQRGVSLEKLISDLKENITTPANETFKDEKGIYEMVCGIPTIINEYKLEEELRGEKELKDISDFEELRQNLGDLFIGELSKYIKELYITEGDKKTKIDFNTISFRNRIAVIEKLPEKLTKSVISYINDVKKELNKVTLAKIDVGTTEEPNVREENFTIDSSFFTLS